MGVPARAAETKPPAKPAAAALSADPAGIEFFETKIRPVLVESCYSCHSAGAKNLKAKLYLDSRDGILKGGESDQPAIVPGDADESTLIRAIRHEDEGLTMPPKKKLPAEQIASFEAWVKMGAPMPAAPAAVAGATPTTKPHEISIAEGKKHWSFQPPRDLPIPSDVSAVDYFVHGKLKENNLAPAPRADKRTLIRRATFDLIGLPPTIAEVEKFEADASPDAFEKLIDRLLASPQYGERWGRYWLDVARYADTKGYVFEEERRYAFSYTYRDWVIRAFNEDLPYDQFLIQQIAADRLDLKEDKRPLAALGFLTLGRRFLNNVPDIIDDRIDVVTRGAMALTVSCARCHDHKYDPIPTADYYSLYGVFASTREPDPLPLIGGQQPDKVKEYDAELKKRHDELEAYTNAKHEEMHQKLRTREMIVRYLLEAQKGAGPQPLPEFEINDGTSLVPFVTKQWDDFLKAAAANNDPVFAAWRKFLAIPTSEFTAKSPAVAMEIARTPSINPLVARFVTGPTPPKSMKDVAERYAAMFTAFDATAAHPDPSVEAVREITRGEHAPVVIGREELKRVLSTADQATRRQLRQKIDNLTATHPGSPSRAMAVEDLPTPVEPTIFKRGNAQNPGAQVPRAFLAVLSPDKPQPFKDGSGRLELAKAIATKENPLTARVMVNRVWQFHFGYGLVRTPSDFGTRGEGPSHPELLDHLALRFANEDAWSIKKLHKRIMLSATYQQSSGVTPSSEAIARDPENRLLWRMNPRRLDLEAMRDSLLAASGEIDLTMGGRPVDILAQPFVPRRTVYAYIDRQNLPGMFRTFDLASPDATSGQRFATSVPQQALFIMNSPFVIEQSKKLAARPEVKEQPDAAKRVNTLFRVALGRTPSKAELELGVKFVTTEEAQPKSEIAVKQTPWQYGYGEFDEPSQRLKGFYPLPHFTGAIWQGGPALPDPKLTWVLLTRDGGHAGSTHALAAVRRWAAPRDVTVSVAGIVAHNLPKAGTGDGVRARLISSREGLLATWNIFNRSAETKISSITLKQGETLDFVVDNGRANNVDNDSFSWPVTITKQAAVEPVAGDDTGGSWSSVKEFTGPPAAPPNPMTPWEKFAQVLLESNEFVFVD
ncbi:MAG: hypothetical protein QOF78_1201 [Phycisphaerales bacterium]|nr:hypothetical protein [Phycisphaerales bacterium]